MKVKDLGNRKFEFEYQGYSYKFECPYDCVYSREITIDADSPLQDLIKEDMSIFDFILNWLDEKKYVVTNDEWIQNKLQLFLEEIKYLPRDERRKRIKDYEKENDMEIRNLIKVFYLT